MSYRERFKFEPLRIRAYLRSAIVCDEYMPLDGVLLYQAYRYALGAQTVTIPGDYTEQGGVTLPLEIEHPGKREWYYRCSWAQWSAHIDGRDYWNKRFDARFADLVDFGKRKPKVIIEQGKYKAYHMPIFYRSAHWVEWYCLGDRAEIERLLCTVIHLGKKSSQGWGRIDRWQVDAWPADWSVYRSDGYLMRGIPLEDVADKAQPVDLFVYGIRPSYWKRSNQMPLVKPS